MRGMLSSQLDSVISKVELSLSRLVVVSSNDPSLVQFLVAFIVRIFSSA